MNVEKLITDYFDVWTGAVSYKNGSARGNNGETELTGIQKLRDLILDLAVRGKLVPQDPDDESATDLLDRAKKEKAQLQRDGKIRRLKTLSPVTEGEKPFEIPVDWVWARLGEITSYGASDKAEPGAASPGTWVLELEDIEKGSSRILARVDAANRPFKSTKNVFEKGDVLYGKLRPYLDKVLVAPESGVCTTEIIPIRAFADIRSDYLRWVLKSSHFRQYANDSTHGMNLPRLGTDKARNALVPLPPCNEQRRVEERLDELMALCDRLEQQTSDQISSHEILVESLLDTVTRPRDGADLARSWVRLSDQFDVLLSTPGSAQRLKGAIKKLGVLGRLTTRSRSDRSAISDLQQSGITPAKGERARLICSEAGHVPCHWALARLGDLGRIVGGSTPAKSDGRYWRGSVPWVTPKDMKRDVIDHTAESVTEAAVVEANLRKVPAGSVMVVVRGMILAHTLPTAVAGTDVVMNQDMKAIVGPAVEPKYIRLVMQGFENEFLDLVERSTHGTCKLRSESLWETVLPIPPVDEQRKIVDTVSELLALCDRLDSGIQSGLETQAGIARTLVRAMT